MIIIIILGFLLQFLLVFLTLCWSLSGAAENLAVTSSCRRVRYFVPRKTVFSARLPLCQTSPHEAASLTKPPTTQELTLPALHTYIQSASSSYLELHHNPTRPPCCALHAFPSSCAGRCLARLSSPRSTTLGHSQAHLRR